MAGEETRFGKSVIQTPERIAAMPGVHEVTVPHSRMLRHVLNIELSQQRTDFFVVPADADFVPVFRPPFYTANIGTDIHPLLLELRFEPIDLRVGDIVHDGIDTQTAQDSVHIALLMTNERNVGDLISIGQELHRRVFDRGIRYGAIIAPDSLGSRLSQEIARVDWAHMSNVVLTSLQKGKATPDETGDLRIGPPKPWVRESAGVEVRSGTSHAGARQMLYLDQKMAARLRGVPTLLVDDARLSQGTITAAITLARRFGIPISGIATVLNEGNMTDEIDGIPYVGITKLPLFAPVAGGFQPITGTYDGLDKFYVPKSANMR